MDHPAAGRAAKNKWPVAGRGGRVAGSRVTGMDKAAAYAYGTVQAAPSPCPFTFRCGAVGAEGLHSLVPQTFPVNMKEKK